MAWPGLAWLGLAWLVLAWLGSAWLGLFWLGLAWLGLGFLFWRLAASFFLLKSNVFHLRIRVFTFFLKIDRICKHYEKRDVVNGNHHFSKEKMKRRSAKTKACFSLGLALAWLSLVQKSAAPSAPYVHFFSLAPSAPNLACIGS